MWFKLEATSCYKDIDAYRKYCKELSTFNIRILNVPHLSFSGIVLKMDVLVLIELNTLEDFIRLRDSLDIPLILRATMIGEREEDDSIEIYDDWRE